jgi:meiotic recombination protein SPO11
MGIGGKAIPPNVDKVEDMRSDAKFILLVEKDAAFMRLAEDRFYNKYPCIIITGKGQPDVATRCAQCDDRLLPHFSLITFTESRLFLKKTKTELRIPVLGLVDSDPSGLKVRQI